MDAVSIISEVQRRLTALADDPPYRFVRTPEKLAEAYQQRLKTFVGYSEPEVAQAELKMGVRFPTVFRTYLLSMGKSSGDLFQGSSVAGIEDFEQYRTRASKVLDYSADHLSCSVNWRASLEERHHYKSQFAALLTLPDNAIVFAHNDWCQFCYFVADGSFDSPVYGYTECDPAPSLVAPGFAAFLKEELDGKEEYHRKLHERGGYDITIDGKVRRKIYPAMTSGNRPLENPSPEKKWWKFWT
jgi:hypothetical protein